MLFSCFKCYSILPLISQNTKYTWVPSSRRPKETPARAIPVPLQHPPSSSLHHDAPQFSPSWHKIKKQREAYNEQYLVQSIDFFLSVNNIPSTTISKMQGMDMKIRRWLTRSTTVAVIHHPDMLGVPFLPELQTKAKLTYLSSVFPSDDPVIQ